MKINNTYNKNKMHDICLRFAAVFILGFLEIESVTKLNSSGFVAKETKRQRGNPRHQR